MGYLSYSELVLSKASAGISKNATIPFSKAWFQIDLSCPVRASNDVMLLNQIPGNLVFKIHYYHGMVFPIPVSKHAASLSLRASRIRSQTGILHTKTPWKGLEKYPFKLVSPDFGMLKIVNEIK